MFKRLWAEKINRFSVGKEIFHKITKRLKYRKIFRSLKTRPKLMDQFFKSTFSEMARLLAGNSYGQEFLQNSRQAAEIAQRIWRLRQTAISYLRQIQKSAAAKGARLTLLDLKTKILNFVLTKAKSVLTQKFLIYGKLAKLQIKKYQKFDKKRQTIIQRALNSTPPVDLHKIMMMNLPLQKKMEILQH